MAELAQKGFKGLEKESIPVLIKMKTEDVLYLFFKCRFSCVIWRKMLLYLKEYHVPKEWNEEMCWVIGKGTGRSFKSRLRRLYFATAVYYVWITRNKMIFEGAQPDADRVATNCICGVISRGNS
ncbi:hypothetical protein LIER_20713 [Lithospermum erythrorhizon]|uniref:Reverse transcriptase n=1 Tax=Lithospermum erythrorhizon TaxID=34254 RepID=A0AAV3QT47_LITER